MKTTRTSIEYYTSETESSDASMVPNRSHCKPSTGEIKALDKVCDYISYFPYNELPHPQPKYSTSIREWENIHNLQTNNAITIKKADKDFCNYGHRAI